MAESFISTKDKISFREIALNHLKKILELSTVEFKGGYWKSVFHGNTVEKEYVPDTRRSYIQSVESLSHILIPYFDNKMIGEFKEYIKGSKKIKETLAKNKEEKDKFTIKKLELCSALFIDLNLLLRRNDYLKKGIYSEEDFDEEDLEDEEPEDKKKVEEEKEELKGKDIK